MRLIVTLKNTEKIKPVERKYIRNFVFDCLRNSKWSFYHDKGRYKHFNFSNLFPFNPDTGDIESDFNLIISSPYDELIQIIQKRMDYDKEIKIGEKFEVTKTKLIHTPKIIDKVMTATPILIRLHGKQYDKYGIKSDKKYISWTEKETLNAFLDQLTQNLVNRYNDFKLESKFLGFKNKYEDYQNTPHIFSTLKYKKTVHGWDKYYPATMWEFGISEQYKSSDIVKYMYEAGLGEKNGGFLNLIKSI